MGDPMNDKKGVIILWGAILLTIWGSTLGAVMVVRAETGKLIDRARLTDPLITDNVAIVRGVGGLGQYLVIRSELVVEDMIGGCPPAVANGLCVRVE